MIHVIILGFRFKIHFSFRCIEYASTCGARRGERLRSSTGLAFKATHSYMAFPSFGPLHTWVSVAHRVCSKFDKVVESKKWLVSWWPTPKGPEWAQLRSLYFRRSSSLVVILELKREEGKSGKVQFLDQRLKEQSPTLPPLRRSRPWGLSWRQSAGVETSAWRV